MQYSTRFWVVAHNNFKSFQVSPPFRHAQLLRYFSRCGLFLLLLLTLLTSELRGQSYAPSLGNYSPLVNGGFETGELSPWFQARVVPSNQAGENWHVTAAEAKSGVYSATLTGNRELRQNFSPIPTDEIFSLSFWAKHPVITVDQIAFTFFYTDGSTRETVRATTTTDFEYFDLTSQLYTGKQLNGISIWGNIYGRTYVDDVSIVLIPEPTAFTLMGISSLVLGIRRNRSRRNPTGIQPNRL